MSNVFDFALPPLPTLDEEGCVLYFAYGSNLCPDQMAKRCPNAELLYAATITGWAIDFCGYSRGWGGGVATIVRRKGATVEGLVYRLTLDDVLELDACEGAPFVYDRVEINMDDGRDLVPCIVYVHNRPHTRRAPSMRYFRQIREAYEEYGFDKEPLLNAVARYAPRRRSKAKAKAKARPQPKPAKREEIDDMTTDTHPHLVFTYGTLLHGQPNHRLLDCAGAEFVGEDATRHEFHLLDVGYFPGVVRGGKTAVSGELYRVDDATLAGLDRLEGTPHLYTRERVRTEAGLVAWVYVLTTDHARGLPRIVSGDWKAHEAAKRGRSMEGGDDELTCHA